MIAKTPPMGWNSWDCYGASVTEETVRKNAEFMSVHLKKYGWEYIVVDIQWSEPNAKSHEYRPFADLCMDEYGRLLPAENRFPSSAGGKGFAPLAEYVHSLGLKFGIHIMRGIPRQAVHRNCKIKGTDKTAREVAKTASICAWNTDMYGVDPSKDGARAYYDSIFELYASWGVDFIKCDDICRELPHEEEELIMLSKALHDCGRDMVLSLSPGPAVLEKAELYKRISNMWRITDDFWDQWELLLPMFERCELWQSHVQEGCFPDCDMLTLGRLGKGFGHEWQCNFTKEEQITMLTLWCIFRSPLMIGTDLTLLDDWTKGLLTNRDVLGLLSHSAGARQIQRSEKKVVWCSKDTKENAGYLAMFNLEEKESEVPIPWEAVSQYGIQKNPGKELWSGEMAELQKTDAITIPAHGAKLFKL